MREIRIPVESLLFVTALLGAALAYDSYTESCRTNCDFRRLRRDLVDADVLDEPELPCVDDQEADAKEDTA